MAKYEKEFGIKMKPEEVYGYAAQFLPTLGYRFVSGDKPNTISFTRGGHMGTFFSFDIKKEGKMQFSSVYCSKRRKDKYQILF